MSRQPISAPYLLVRPLVQYAPEKLASLIVRLRTNRGKIIWFLIDKDIG